MSTIDPHLMRTFRSKMKHPKHFHRVCRVLARQRHQDLKDYGNCCGMIDELSQCLEVPVTPEQRDQHAKWLMSCGVDPKNRSHRHQMWRLVQSHGNRKSWL